MLGSDSSESEIFGVVGLLVLIGFGGLLVSVFGLEINQPGALGDSVKLLSTKARAFL